MGRRSRGADVAGPGTHGALALQGWEDGDVTTGLAAGPYDAEELDPDLTEVERVDFGSIRVPVPAGGRVVVEKTDGRLQAVHVVLPGGRLSVSALAAPRGQRLWPDLVAEIDTSLRDGGASVRSYQGEWGRELHARTGGASSVFVGADGARWMVYGVATGPSRDAEELDAALRQVLRGLVVARGKAPYPPRTVLPLTVPPHLAGQERAGAAEQEVAEEFALRTPEPEREAAEPPAGDPDGPGEPEAGDRARAGAPPGEEPGRIGSGAHRRPVPADALATVPAFAPVAPPPTRQRAVDPGSPGPADACGTGALLPAEPPPVRADDPPTEPLRLPDVAAPGPVIPGPVTPAPDLPTVPFPVVPPVARTRPEPADPPVRRRSRHARPEDGGTGPLPQVPPSPAQPALAFLAGDPMDLFDRPDRPGRHRRPE